MRTRNVPAAEGGDGRGERSAPSRREFLAVATAGFLGLSARPLPQARASMAEEQLLYVGTYTEGDHAGGIHLVHFDTRTGALRAATRVNAGANPSFLAIHPDGRTLYAVNEVTEREGDAAGGVSAFAIAPDSGALTLLNDQSTHGGAPCYVSLDRTGRVVLVANYVGGNIVLLPIRREGMVGAATHTVQHMGSGPVRDRQDAPHAHCIMADPSNRFVLAADLGVDRVLVYQLNVDEETLTHVPEADGVMKPGAGPRHLEFHPSLPLVYVANELDSTVSTCRFDAATGALSPVASQSTLPRGWTGTSYVADIHAAPDGRSLYVSNRGHNSIARFAVARDTGALRLEQHVSTGGDWPRNFSLDPSGRWLLVGNQRSGTVTVFARDGRSGRLTPTSHQLAIPRVACLRFR